MIARRLVQATIAAGTLLGIAGVANATTIYTFDSTAVGGFGAGPYGTVKLEQNGGNVDVTVTLRSDMNFVNTGGPHSVFAFNLSGAVTTDITNVKFNGSALSGFSVQTNGDATPFGTYLLVINCTADKKVEPNCNNGGSNPYFDPLTFTALGALEADFANKNAAGYYFAADAVCSGSSLTGCNGQTGSIAVSGPGRPGDKVPEPGTLALLGLGLLGLGVSKRRVRA